MELLGEYEFEYRCAAGPPNDSRANRKTPAPGNKLNSLARPALEK